MTGCAPVHARIRTAAVAAGVLVVLAVLPAAAAAQVTIAPTEHDFGEVVVGATGAKQFVLTNGTEEALENLAVAFTSAGPPGAGLAFGHDAPLPDTNCSTVVSVPPDGTCTLDVAFAPDVPGEYDGTVAVTAGAAPAGPTVQLSGTGIPPLEAPATVDFGAQPRATIGAPRTITVTLNGPQTVGVVKVTGTDRDDFLITSDDCSGVTVPGDATCDLHLRFAPSAAGARNATLVVPSGSAQATTVLTGTGGPLPQGPPGEDGEDEDGEDGTPGAPGAPGTPGAPGAPGLPVPRARRGLKDRRARSASREPTARTAPTGPTAPTGRRAPPARRARPAPPARPRRRSASRCRRPCSRAARACPATRSRSRCAAPRGAAGSMGTVTLRTAGRLRGARRTLGTAAFGCAAGQTETVELIVGSRLRRLVRAHGRGLDLTAAVLTRGDGSVRQTATAIALAPTRAQRPRGGRGGGVGAG